MPLLATRHELQGNALGPLLLQQIEQTLLHAGVSCVIMPALPLPAGPSSEAPLPNQAAPLSTPAGVKPWGCLVGYNAPSPAQLLEACRTPMLQLPGTPYLVKQLSHDTLTKVGTYSDTLTDCQLCLFTNCSGTFVACRMSNCHRRRSFHLGSGQGYAGD